MQSDRAPTHEEAERLLHRWHETGDREALDQLLATEIVALKSRIRAQGMHRARADASASDVAHEAVLRLLRLSEPPTFVSPRALREYLWTAAWRLLAERLRRPSSDPLNLDGSGSHAIDAELATTGGLGSLEVSDRAIALRVAVQLLAPGDQHILELVYFRGLELDGAARELGISVDAAKMRCSRARARLAHKLRRWAEIVG